MRKRLLRLQQLLQLLGVLWVAILLINYQFLGVTAPPSQFSKIIAQDTELAMNFMHQEAIAIQNIMQTADSPRDQSIPNLRGIDNNIAGKRVNGGAWNNKNLHIATEDRLLKLQHANSQQMKQYGEFRGPLNKNIKNLIVGSIFNCKPYALAVFLGSIQAAVGTSTDVLLFVSNPISSQIAEIATHYKAVIIAYSLEQFDNAVKHSFDANTLRWILLHHYLHHHSHNQSPDAILSTYQYIMMAHVEDVAVVGNPFAAYFQYQPKADLLFFTEGTMTAATMKRTIDCFGSRLATAIQFLPHINAGVILGTMRGIRLLVDRVNHLLVAQSDIGSGFPQCVSIGVDDAIFGVFVHLGFLDNTTLLPEEKFPIVNLVNSVTSTLQSPLEMPVYQVIRKSDSVMDRVLSTVLHGYDKFPSLSLFFLKTHVYWADYSDFNALWKLESSCSKYLIWGGSDLLAGNCDGDLVSVATPDECCSICDNFHLQPGQQPGIKCSAFIISQGKCFLKTCAASMVHDIVLSHGGKVSKQTGFWGFSQSEVKMKDEAGNSIIFMAYL